MLSADEAGHENRIRHSVEETYKAEGEDSVLDQAHYRAGIVALKMKSRALFSSIFPRTTFAATIASVRWDSSWCQRSCLIKARKRFAIRIACHFRFTFCGSTFRVRVAFFLVRIGVWTCKVLGSKKRDN